LVQWDIATQTLDALCFITKLLILLDLVIQTLDTFWFCFVAESNLVTQTLDPSDSVSQTLDLMGFVLLQNDSVENLIGFNMVSYRSCKNLWKSCVEHHTFFRLYVPNPPSKKIFSMGSKFRYRWGSGNTPVQVSEWSAVLCASRCLEFYLKSVCES
jgi:hypothetical protein